MKYIGSKNKYARELLPIILKNRKQGQWYIEPFVGGANIIDKVSGHRLGNDNNVYLIALLKFLQNGGVPPYLTKEQYCFIKNNKSIVNKVLVGWAGIGCSYSGKWFGGFAGTVETKNGRRNYQKEAIQNVLRQVDGLEGVAFVSCDYRILGIPNNSIIYCDPPYRDTLKYDNNEFDYNEFWKWCEEKVKSGNEVFVSEYNAPDKWKCVYEKETYSSLSANGKTGGSKKSVEKLFIIV